MLKKRIINKSYQYLNNFSKNTSIHGMQYVGNTKISKLERLMWFIIAFAAFSFSYGFLKSNLEHYFANPTVVTMEKDYRNWENAFPATTACYVNRVDQKKAEMYIEKQFKVKPHDEKFNYYMNFVNLVSNLTYNTFHKLEYFKNDDNLTKNIDYLSLVQETKVKFEWEFVITELGLCFTLNSMFSELLSPKLKSFKDFTMRNVKNYLKCHFLNGVCYARYDSDPSKPIMYYIHSHLDVIHATSDTPILVKKSEEYDVNYKLAETYSMDDIRYLTPNQRNCNFYDEPTTTNMLIYSTSICFMECRYRIAKDKCGCKPFFYNFFGKKGESCDLKGMLCLSKISYLFNQSSKLIGCNCPQPCNLMVYLRQIPKKTIWNHQFFDERITFRWGLIPPTTKYHRKILFGIQELTVSLGGALSLFLGISFISVIETIYLICENLFYYIQNKRNVTQVMVLKRYKRKFQNYNEKFFNGSDRKVFSLLHQQRK
ncbi:hypothetical protein ABEB36_003770 [Hypothenemus hampei]|uniref:Sodium channel protein Nach n=1 Tax=Hypothenemus hampei TaxID=57062 RepID=A0ABD1F1N6_HYPHA